MQKQDAIRAYLGHAVLWEHRFADIFIGTEDGRLAIDYRLFHDTEPIKLPTPSSS